MIHEWVQHVRSERETKKKTLVLLLSESIIIACLM